MIQFTAKDAKNAKQKLMISDRLQIHPLALPWDGGLRIGESRFDQPKAV